MKRLIILVLFFSGCSGGLTNADHDKILEEKIASFNETLSEKQKNFIHSFFNNRQVSPEENFKGVTGGFCCIFQGIDRDQTVNNNIVYQEKENQSLKDLGYKITRNGDSLNFVFFRDLHRNVVGKYSNGGQAITYTTYIYALDLDKETGYLLTEHQGGGAPSSIKARRYTSTGGSGSAMTDEEILKVYRDNINKN